MAKSSDSSAPLSVIVPCFNEETVIAECLESVKFADELVLVDSFSTDRTLEIARRYTNRILQHEFWSHGAQNNWAIPQAKHDWVLIVDADERVTPELAAEIQQAMARNDFAAYTMGRLSWYCGKFIQHAGWRPDYVLRLFRRDCAQFSNDLVHERVMTQQPVGQLHHHLLHYSYQDFSQVLAKVDAYSSAAAQQAFNRGERGSMGKAIGHGAWAFVRTYVLRAGFLDGAHGLALAISNAQTSYYKYVKLWAMAQPAPKAR